MAKRICHLSEQEVSAFRRRERASHDAAEVRRLQAVRLYGSRKPVSEIADVTGCVESSLRRWVGRYQQQGLDGLKGQYEGSSHNPSKLTAAQRVEIQERLHRYRPDQVLSPAVRVSHGQFWTVSDLHLALEAWYAVIYERADSYRKLLHACGMSYQRTEGVYKSRPSETEIADFEAELEKK